MNTVVICLLFLFSSCLRFQYKANINTDSKELKHKLSVEYHFQKNVMFMKIVSPIESSVKLGLVGFRNKENANELISDCAELKKEEGKVKIEDCHWVQQDGMQEVRMIRDQVNDWIMIQQSVENGLSDVRFKKYMDTNSNEDINQSKIQNMMDEQQRTVVDQFIYVDDMKIGISMDYKDTIQKYGLMAVVNITCVIVVLLT